MMNRPRQSMNLRPYQSEAVAETYRFLRERTGNPCIVIPTGGGKTPVMATICRDAVLRWNGRVVVLAGVKELLEQTADTLARMAPDLPVGVYSAGLGRREMNRPVTVAGIHSIHRRALELPAAPNLVLIDEAHQIPPDGDGMYRTLLDELRARNPRTRFVGLTATPYRTTTGPVCTPDGILNEVCYEAGVRELVVKGWLSKLVSKTVRECDTSKLHIERGEFVAAEATALMASAIEPACREIVRLAEGRRSILVFCQCVAHAETVREKLSRLTGERTGLVVGESLDFERAEAVAGFKDGSLRWLVNVNVLTTGFDAPNVDCVALLRPTASPGLYYQMVGRGFRLCEGKTDCLVLDFGGNIKRHGPVDMVRSAARPGRGGAPPTKTCPECQSEVLAGYSQCPDCGWNFPPREIGTHDETASTENVLGGETVETKGPPTRTTYHAHLKRGAPPGSLPTMRVEYEFGLSEVLREWVCIEHDGFAGRKARDWWIARSADPLPESVMHAVTIARAGGLAEPREIEVRSTGKGLPRLTAKRLSPKPPATGIPAGRMPGDEEEDDWRDAPVYAHTNGDDEVPF